MKRKDGKITHLTLGEYIHTERLPEPDMATAAKIKTEVKLLCDQGGKDAYPKRGAGIRTGLPCYQYPVELLQKAYENVLRNIK